MQSVRPSESLVKVIVQELAQAPCITLSRAERLTFALFNVRRSLVVKGLADIHGRIPEMDRHGIEHIILSLTSPGPQGEVDKEKAEALAKRANDVRNISRYRTLR